ncbi:beta-lactamase/transpeptidase-like protein [Punctularia strigosozonata HHB-11173 SS5]|uniref:beta-lactamase/transpeptidase-like protein n=1 Tax=Punctularia strigosozonata (strain HHB-11173) TaxID=741275 RepID=UPI00044176F5|nr:beta-lactamase/transpeptidase-like protein [Punctularia strigosozonata HHB-11173 SS5]EIN06834.1 beta-lactamase/transpeptidase-like protein [Punctularia strigosozonata HHB-11173 SS5]
MLHVARFALLLSVVPHFAGVYGTTQQPLVLDTPSESKIIDERFGSFVQEVLANETISGISVAVVRPDGEVELGAWGIRTEQGDDMEPDAFLSASMGILIDDFASGRNATALPSSVRLFDWETKVKAVLPGEWELEDEWATEKANIRDILSHVSGLPRYVGDARRQDTTKDVVSRLKDLRAAFELRHTWSYNNQMYMVGSYIISKYSGMPYEQFVVERVFKPLNMSDSMFSQDQAAKTGRFSDSWNKYGRRIPRWFERKKIAELSAGAGGVITTAADLSRWLRMLMNEGVDPDTNVVVIPKSAFAAATTASAIIDGYTKSNDLSIQGYGMGWLRHHYMGRDLIWHSGGIPGISTFVGFFPNDNLGLAVLANADEKSLATMRVATEILQAALKVTADEPFPKAALDVHRSQGPRNVTVEASSEVETEGIDLSIFAGTYTNAGYGSFTLCAPKSSSHYCDEVHQDFESVDAASPNPPPSSQKANQLLAAWPRLWSSHLRLVRHADSSTTFNITMDALFPQGYGANKTAFGMWETESDATVEFVVDETGRVEGAGLIGTVVGKTTDRQRWGKNAQERADAWFTRV